MDTNASIVETCQDLSQVKAAARRAVEPAGRDVPPEAPGIRSLRANRAPRTRGSSPASNLAIGDRTAPPIVLDSTEPAVLQAGLEMPGGGAIVNSVNHEDGDDPESRFTGITRLVKEQRRRGGGHGHRRGWAGSGNRASPRG
ncbi:hypothetical protein AB0M95_11245 [Sphaerisporangium sp. NPDC051017]|uniref:hypothetical protein n=1 Tax=Sphaerisporangium sp. NPDC051017 TaxID=3154636 RepID=UPI00344A795E